MISISYIKKYFFGALFLSFLFLSGCGSDGEMQTIETDNFIMDIPASFERVAPGLVENKQIINKVIASYKQDQEGFSPNLIITTSLLEEALDFEQFRTANTNKLKNFVVGYTPGEKELISFDCGEDRIQGIFVTFQVQNSLFSTTDTYALSQYQFVMNKQGYIISTAYINPDEQKNLKKRIKTLQCRKEMINDKQ